MVAMQHGPVLSETYDLIKGEHMRAAEWTDRFDNIGYNVRLASDPGTGRLSRYEIEKLTDVTQRFEHQWDWAVAEETHRFEEWQRNDPGDSSRPIPLEHVLEAVGRKKDIEAIRQDAEAVAFLDGVLEDL